MTKKRYPKWSILIDSKSEQCWVWNCKTNAWEVFPKELYQEAVDLQDRLRGASKEEVDFLMPQLFGQKG